MSKTNVLGNFGLNHEVVGQRSATFYENQKKSIVRNHQQRPIYLGDIVA